MAYVNLLLLNHAFALSRHSLNWRFGFLSFSVMLVPFWLMTLPAGIVPPTLSEAPFSHVAAAPDCFLTVITF